MMKVPERKLKSDETSDNDTLEFPLCANASNEHGENENRLEIQTLRVSLGMNFVRLTSKRKWIDSTLITIITNQNTLIEGKI